MPRLRHCLAALACLSGAYTSGAGAAEPADLVIKHAQIYTADAKRSMATALAVRDGKLTFVGSDAELSAWIGPKTAVRDAGGRLLLPGLFDSHIHATSVVQLDACDLKNRAVTLKELSRFVQGCSVRYHVPAGEWVNVRQWNYSNGTQPDGARPTIRAALDLASRKHPIQLIGTDGHHLAFNSVALARAKNNAGKVIGYSKATLAADFKELRKLVGVDEYGEPNGTVNDEGRPPLGALFILDVDLPEVMKAPERITARQLADPDDVARIGRDHLYLALTYSWAYSDPEYDLSIVPFYDKVLGGDDVALHPANGYYEQRIYVTRSLRDAGAILVAGSDAPVNTQDPQPFVNMSLAVTRHLPGKPALTPAQSIPIRDVVDAYTISGARYLGRDTEAGSIEAGKSADFIVLDRDIFALSDAGKADDVARTQVLETWFMGKAVYEKPVTKAKSAKH